MAENGGQITWNLDVDDTKFNAKLAKSSAAAQVAGKSLNGVGQGIASSLSSAFGGIADFTSRASNSVNSLADSIRGKLLVVSALGGAALGAMAKASLDMVSSVQKSTLALTTYTGSAQTAAAITKDLIDFARSPQGVLFNRDELLQSAVLLRGAGAETSKLTGYIKAMAPAVAVSGRSFSEIAQILSKVVATGQLSAIEFDQLADRGIVLDKAMRGTKVSADDLFAALSKRIPADQLDKYAQTVEGMKIRFKSAFRELGNALLGVQYGVNEFGASFAPGSLGEAASKALVSLTAQLKSPAVVASMARLGQTAKVALEIMRQGFGIVLANIDEIVKGVTIAAGAFVALKVAAASLQAISVVASGLSLVSGALAGIGSAIAAFGAAGGGIAGVIAALGGPITLIIAGIVALVAGLTYLVIKFKLVDDIIRGIGAALDWLAGVAQEVGQILKPLFDAVSLAASVLWNAITTMLVPAWNQLMVAIQPLLPILQYIAIALGVLIVGAILVFTTALLLVIGIIVVVVTAIIKTVTTLYDAISWGMNAIVAVWSWGWNLAMSVLSAIWGVIMAVVRGTVNWIVGIVNTGVSTIVAIWRGITAIVGIVVGAFNAVFGFIGGAAGRMVGFGRSIIQGLVNGIKSMPGAIMDAVKSVAGKLWGVVSKALGVESPSTIAYWYGQMIMQGLANGITAGQGMVSGLLDKVMPTPPNISSELSSGTTGSSASGVTNIFNQKVLTEADVDMAANRAAYQQGLALR